MKVTPLVLAGIALWLSPASSAAQRSTPKASMNITLTIGGQTLKATLTNTATARDFYSLLPLTLTLEDYASTEKIAYPPRKLSTQGAPAGSTPRAGDLAYYAPWGNLALFHKDFGYSSGLVILGRLSGDLAVLRKPGQVKVTIEKSR